MDPDAVWDGEWGQPGIYVLDGVHMPQKEWTVLGIFRHLHPIGLNGQNDVFSHRNVFDSCVKS